MSSTRISASRDIAAPAAVIFDLIADPARQPEWDGNGNLVASTSPRVRAQGDVFVMENTSGKIKENHVVEFAEGSRIGWLPADRGTEPPGHLWLWELEPIDEDHTRVRHSYDYSALSEEQESGAHRLAHARSMTPEKLDASLQRLAALAERRVESEQG